MATTATLVHKTLLGDRDAFDELVERHLGLVHGIILNKVRRPDEVEDLVQDVFVKAYQELSTLRDPRKFGPWLGRIAVNRAQAWLRQRQAQRTTVTDDPGLLETVSQERPDDQLVRSERDGILWQALDRLPPEQRQILLLFHFEDVPQLDIARFLGISLPTVKWRLMRARKALRRRVEEVVWGSVPVAARRRQRERIAGALPALVAATRPSTRWLSPAWLALRQGLTFGGALVLGAAGSLLYEMRAQSVEAEVPPVAQDGRIRLWLDPGLAADGVPTPTPWAQAGDPGSAEDGTLLLPPCSAGRVRRR